MFCKLFVIFLFGSISRSVIASSRKNTLEIYTERTVKSLEKVVSFYADNVDKVNLDSIYGLRVAQGGLASILKVLSVDSSFFPKIASLHKIIKNASEQALPYLKDYQPDYYNQFKPIVDKPWTIFKDFRRMASKSGISNLKHFKDFDEKISDNCMCEITGTSPHSKRPCHVSLDCLKLMTNNNMRRYGNTHQILYFLIAFQTGCRHVVEKEFQKFRGYLEIGNILNVDTFLEKKCEQIFVEMNELKQNVVGHYDTDLFMEQGFVCGILGYEDFLQRDILENIFLWQDKEHGCFGTENSDIQVKLLNHNF